MGPIPVFLFSFGEASSTLVPHQASSLVPVPFGCPPSLQAPAPSPVPPERRSKGKQSLHAEPTKRGYLGAHGLYARSLCESPKEPGMGSSKSQVVLAPSIVAGFLKVRIRKRDAALCQQAWDL